MTDLQPLSAAELEAESGTALPAKEVMSLLDLNANLDLALDTAAPIDLAIGANANIAAPINAAVDANVLSLGSDSQAGAIQTGSVHQGILGNATATSDQHSSIDQGNPATTDPASTTGPTGSTSGSSGSLTGDPTTGPLINVNLDLNADLHLASPIDGAIAANANAAAPINAAAGANIGSIDSHATALGEQNVSIDQGIQGDATATGHQDSAITQGSGTHGSSTQDAAPTAPAPQDAGTSTSTPPSGTP